MTTIKRRRRFPLLLGEHQRKALKGKNPTAATVIRKGKDWYIHLVIEKDIRRKTKTWNKHRNRMVAGWSFYQLQQFVKYKAAAMGIATSLINPAYTSQTCHLCLQLGSRNQERFTCLTCGEQHADVNASHVIALGGVVCKPARISGFFS